MNTLRRMLMLLCLAAWTGHATAETATKSGAKASAKTPAGSEPASKARTDLPKPETSAKSKDKPDQPRPAVVSTMSIEEISGFSKFPKQVQSLVQSALALTHLELGYLYGSHEPNKGGMDCSGAVYHVLLFQGLKDVPRQSDEMCQWVEKKSHLRLTPTATSFESSEFADLKPGDLLFWTNTTETKRKLPVTHVMIYLGKHKETGRRIVFGSSDGRSFQGERRSGVSVFDFRLPPAGSSKHFFGYGHAPGLLPAETKPVTVATLQQPDEKTSSVEKPTPKAVEKAAKAEEEVRKAVTVSEARPEPKSTDKLVSATKMESKPTLADQPAAKTVDVKPQGKVVVKKGVEVGATPKTSSETNPKTAATKEQTTTTSSTRKRSTSASPPRNEFERRVDKAVGSIRRFFQS